MGQKKEEQANNLALLTPVTELLHTHFDKKLPAKANMTVHPNSLAAQKCLVFDGKQLA